MPSADHKSKPSQAKRQRKRAGRFANGVRHQERAGIPRRLPALERQRRRLLPHAQQAAGWRSGVGEGSPGTTAATHDHLRSRGLAPARADTCSRFAPASASSSCRASRPSANTCSRWRARARACAAAAATSVFRWICPSPGIRWAAPRICEGKLRDVGRGGAFVLSHGHRALRVTGRAGDRAARRAGAHGLHRAAWLGRERPARKMSSASNGAPATLAAADASRSWFAV